MRVELVADALAIRLAAGPPAFAPCDPGVARTAHAPVLASVADDLLAASPSPLGSHARILSPTGDGFRSDRRGEFDVARWTVRQDRTIRVVCVFSSSFRKPITSGMFSPVEALSAVGPFSGDIGPSLPAVIQTVGICIRLRGMIP